MHVSFSSKSAAATSIIMDSIRKIIRTDCCHPDEIVSPIPYVDLESQNNDMLCDWGIFITCDHVHVQVCLHVL